MNENINPDISLPLLLSLLPIEVINRINKEKSTSSLESMDRTIQMSNFMTISPKSVTREKEEERVGTGFYS